MKQRYKPRNEPKCEPQGVFSHFRSEPRNRKLAVLPRTRLYVAIKFDRESYKSNLASIRPPSDIGETGIPIYIFS